MSIKAGINPVTIRSDRHEDPCLTIMRMGISIESNEPFKNSVTVAMFDEKTKQPLGMVTIPEQRFIQALGYNFPGGELVQAHLNEPEAEYAETRRKYVSSPCSEQVMRGVNPCLLEEGSISFDTKSVAIKLYPNFFGQPEREWEPSTKVREAIINMNASFWINPERGMDGKWFVLAMFDSYTDMMIKLPTVKLALAGICKSN